MFTINTDRTIRMNRAEDAQFPLFINNGTRYNPIRYEFEPNDGCEIYFYIIPLHKPFEKFLLKKTFNTDGTITTEKPRRESISTHVDTIINDNKDVVILLKEDDTKDLDPGLYTYLVRAKVLTEKINSKNIVKDSTYITLQVTNRYDFYLLDDEANRAE